MKKHERTKIRLNSVNLLKFGSYLILISYFCIVKCHRLLSIIILGILTVIPSTTLSREYIDSLVLERVFNYRHNFTDSEIQGFTTYVYVKNNYNVWRRNFTLWLIPSMYSIADGERYLVAESYNKLHFKDINEYEAKRQVCYSTIRHNRRAMPTVIEFLTPNLYDICLYRDHILSPFNRHNKHYYHYRVLPSINNSAIVEFRPMFLENTQLVSGTAYIDTETGRVIKATIRGEFDMIRFRTETTQGDNGARSLLPKECKTSLQFKFMGNEIYATVDAYYDCSVTLPDSLENVFDLALMDSIRPIPLTAQESHILRQYAESTLPDSTQLAD